MSRVKSILDKARYQLADPNKTRWSDELLLSFLSEAQQDASNQALLLKKFFEMPLYEGVAEYDLPEDFLRLESAWLLDDNKTPIKFKSYQELNSTTKEWETKVGIPSHIVYDLAKSQTRMRIYPIPETTDRELLLTGEPYGVISGGDDIFIDTPYGTVSNINSDSVKQVSKFGIITDIYKVFNMLRINYHYKPKELTSVDDELEVAPAIDKALKHYVVFIALRNDMDSFNRAVANEEANLYQREMQSIISDSAKDYLYDNQDTLVVRYDTGFAPAHTRRTK